MTNRREEFFQSVASHVFGAAVRSTEQLLADPPGGRPDPRLVAASAWFNALRPAEREQAMFVARIAADGALFGLFCAIDGSRRLLADVDHLSVSLVSQDGDATELTEASYSLHEGYRELVPPFGR